jgi:hypothetical protein
VRDNVEAEDPIQDVFLRIARECRLQDSSKSSARWWVTSFGLEKTFGRVLRTIREDELDA